MRRKRCNDPEGPGLVTTRQRDEADTPITYSQLNAAIVMVTALVIAFILWRLAFLVGVVFFVTMVYMLVFVLKLHLGIHSLGHPPAQVAYTSVGDPDTLPVITAFCPLLKESKVVGRLVRNLYRLQWPAGKLEVLLLIRENDEDTRGALRGVVLPRHFRVVTIYPEDYGTKPAALNVGLNEAIGEYCIIYDAENNPEPAQLLKLYAGFKDAPDNIKAVSAIPRVSNWQPKRSKLWSRFQAVEYAAHYGLLNPALMWHRLLTPLSGNSVLFKTEAIRAVGCYDRHNKTEDADLSVRLARRGWWALPIDSETTEEAPGTFWKWVKQRRRWIDGFMQTYMVHMRHPLELLRDLKPKNFIVFQLIIGGTPFVLLLNPLLWGLTAAYWLTGSSFIESLYPRPALYMGVATSIVGMGTFTYSLMIAAMQRRMYSLVLLMLAAPFYWVGMSLAAYIAVYDFAFQKGWHKTDHDDEEERVPDEADTLFAADFAAGGGD